jgi:hypothetical protein
MDLLKFLMGEHSVNETVYLALITMIGTTIASTVASILAYLKSQEGLVKSGENRTAIQQIHVMVNDRLTQLLKTSIELAHAQGVVAGGVAEVVRSDGVQALRRTDEAEVRRSYEAVAAKGTPSGPVCDNTAALDQNTAAVDANTREARENQG